MRQQRKSECRKYGEPDDHLQAKFIVKDFLENKGYDVKLEHPLRIANYYHQYDVVGLSDKKVKIVVEIDDPFNIHKWRHKYNAGLAYAAAENNFKDMEKFVRLNKDEVNGEWPEQELNKIKL